MLYHFVIHTQDARFILHLSSLCVKSARGILHLLPVSCLCVFILISVTRISFFINRGSDKLERSHDVTDGLRYSSSPITRYEHELKLLLGVLHQQSRRGHLIAAGENN